MGQKPPAFQFYAKDWRSSPTVKKMNPKERGLYIDILALAWDSDEPGTITMSVAQICRELRVFSATLRRLLADFPTTLRQEGDKFVQPKLREQWLKYKEISEKRQQAGSKSSAIAQQKHHSAFASAFASSQSKDNPGLQHSNSYFQDKKQEQAHREAMAGAGPSDVKNLGGFKVFTCASCGLEYRSKQRHQRECRAS